MTERRLILASGSRSRASLLANAGIGAQIVKPGVDEDALKQAFSGDADELALLLARAKAEKVSREELDAWVIGADQTLSCEDRLFDKAQTLAEARRNLEFLRGRRHRLHSALALAHQGKTVWNTVSVADLVMRAFSDASLDAYIETVGETMLSSVGCYQLEGPGIALFEKIEGDYFTILGLPLLPLLEALRAQGLVSA